MQKITPLHEQHRTRARAASRLATGLLVALAVLVSSERKTEASPIQLAVTINYLAPAVGPTDATFGFYLFESPTYAWPGPLNPPVLASGGATLYPGTVTFYVSPSVADLSNLYFLAYGSFHSGPGFANTSIFVAEPPSGIVSDALAWQYGPPWISLASLGQGTGLTGVLWTINGYSHHNGGWNEGTWEVAAVPEPATLLLVGIGLVGFAPRAWRYRRALIRTVSR